jgi:predicted Zn-dependent protease
MLTNHTKMLTVALALGLICLAGCVTNPVTGKEDFSLIGPERELALGDQTHPNIIQMYDGEYHDPDLKRYLGTIVLRLHEVSHRPGMPVDFTVLNTSVVNAFATPGHVYATRGFLAKLDNEAQFASVMGHEWAHVAARHTARQMSRSLGANLLMNVGTSLMGDTGGARLAATLTGASITLLGLNYSRSQEHQADRVGTYYMALAGWDPEQAVEMMKILGSLSEHKPGILDKYLSTHPDYDARITDIRNVIREKGLESRYIQGDGMFAERWKGRLAELVRADEQFEPYDEGQKALSEDRHEDALRLAEKAIAGNANFAQFHRLRGDALLELGRTREAQQAYRRSLGIYPRYEPAALGLGQVDLATGDYPSAEQRFYEVTRDWPGSLNAQYGLGLALYKQEKFAAAVMPLEKVAAVAADDSGVLYVLATAYDRTGQAARALQTYTAAVQNGLSGDRKIRAIDRINQIEAQLTKPE